MSLVTSHERKVSRLQQDLEEQLDREKAITQCGICMQRRRDTVLLPCMHFLYCRSVCAPRAPERMVTSTRADALDRLLAVLRPLG